MRKLGLAIAVTALALAVSTTAVLAALDDAAFSAIRATAVGIWPFGSDNRLMVINTELYPEPWTAAPIEYESPRNDVTAGMTEATVPSDQPYVITVSDIEMSADYVPQFHSGGSDWSAYASSEGNSIDR